MRVALLWLRDRIVANTPSFAPGKSNSIRISPNTLIFQRQDRRLIDHEATKVEKVPFPINDKVCLEDGGRNKNERN